MNKINAEPGQLWINIFLGVWEFHDQHDGTDFETMGQMDKTTE